MADDESRAARQKALAEKKRRLEEIKARRRGAAAPTADSAPDVNAAPAANNNNLDSYIDDLLKTSTPGLTLNAAVPAESAAVVAGGDESKAEEKKVSLEEGKAATASAPSPSTTVATPTVAAAKVETFEIAIQCEEDDFPPPSLIDEDEPLDEGSAASDDSNDDDHDNNDPILQSATSYESHHTDNRRSISTSTEIQPSLTFEQKNKMLSSPPFSQFLSTASKRVERLLGASDETMYGILNGSGWGNAGASGSGAASTTSAVDFSVDYANEDEEDYYDDDEEAVSDGVSSTRRKKRRSKKTQEEAYQTGGYFTARATYEFPKFTRGRNVTDIEWCPGHKEWVLASYNAVSGSARGASGGGGEGESGITANMGISNPTTRHLSPHDPSSSFLQTTSGNAIPNEGIVAIYNLSMPSRPEHVFCAGCPILHAQFHPTEHPKLILGGGSSGQVLVWDARVGRYPVQRSSALGGGHDCELVGMKVLGDDANNGAAAGTGSITTSKLVTASSDGKINYWSVSNLREPIEHVNVNANLSCLEVLHGSNNEGVVCGDEKGGLHVVTSGTGRDGSSSNKRVVRRLHPGGVLGGVDGSSAAMEDEADATAMEELEMGHYGMVTSVATRPTIYSPRSNKESTSSAMGGGMSKGFLRGTGGLMVTTGVDWSTKLWAPAYCDGPLMSFLSNSYDYMCDVQWSPVHPSIFATASSNGTLNIWNLASTLDQPVSGTEGIPIDHTGSAAAGNADSLNRLQWSPDGRRMAVASGDKLHVLGVGEDVWKSKGDEEGRVMHNLVSRGLIQQE